MAADYAELRIAKRSSRIAELNAVEEVEDFRSELYSDLLVITGVLEDGQVEVIDPMRAHVRHGARGISEALGPGVENAAVVKPAVQARLRGTFDFRADAGLFGRCPAPKPSDSPPYSAQRIAGLERRDAIDAPAANQLVRNAGMLPPSGWPLPNGISTM